MIGNPRQGASRGPRAAAVAGLLAALAPGAVAGDAVADRVLEELHRARSESGAPALRRSAELDAAAGARAEAIAALSHDRRLSYERPVGEALRDAGVTRHAAAAAHLDMVRGYTRPEIGLSRSWRRYATAWARALEPGWTAVGAATRRADDGWIVFVVVLVEEPSYPEDPATLERALLDAVNAARTERGLDPLAESPELARVARGHSADMAARDYLAHVSPEGLGAAERVDLAEIDFERLGENLHMSRGARDPVGRAVSQWLDSSGHRETMLDPGFERTGVGLAIDERGSFYFTQLFLRPSARPDRTAAP